MHFETYIQDKHAAINLLDRVAERMLNSHTPYTEAWDEANEAVQPVMKLSRQIDKLRTPVDVLKLDGAQLVKMVRNMTFADANPYLEGDVISVSALAQYLSNVCIATSEEIETELGHPMPQSWMLLTPEWHKNNVDANVFGEYREVQP
jgi:hypothetical protein